MSYRQDFQTSGQSIEKLADLLAVGPQDSRRFAAEAELRLREHQAVIRQAEAAERAAEATREGALAAARYTKYTFWILLASIVTAAVAVLSLFQG